MSQDRLVGLALLHMHKDINVTTEQVLDRIVKRKRRVDFVVGDWASDCRLLSVD